MSSPGLDEALINICAAFGSKEEAEKLRLQLAVLDKHARKIQLIDNKILDFEKKISIEEKEKQRLLKDMEDLMEAVPRLTHTLPDGYTITYDHRRKIKINSPAEFLRWLKNKCQTSEVLSFFEDALKDTAIKRFAEKKVDEMRDEGVIEPKIEGLEIGEITYRRLRTFYKEKDNGKRSK